MKRFLAWLGYWSIGVAMIFGSVYLSILTDEPVIQFTFVDYR